MGWDAGFRTIQLLALLAAVSRLLPGPAGRASGSSPRRCCAGQLPFLGNPVDEGAGSAEMDLGDGRGRARDYENGSIYFTPQTGPHEVHGAILGLWASMGFERSTLGYR